MILYKFISQEYGNAYVIRLCSFGVSIFAFPYYIFPAFWYRKLYLHHTYRARIIHCTRYFTIVFRTQF